MPASVKDFLADLSVEGRAMLDSSFRINVTETKYVPSPDDSAFTFPNLDRGEMNCKVIQTCVLYVDMRGSTGLSTAHRRPTVAKLYSVFVRSMIRCAEYNNGKVRGIIGDRVMVLFDTDNCFTNAVDTAILMNTAVQETINKNFEYNNVTAGIGIDYGTMLVTKSGVVKHGMENASYKSLVWLGTPANIASKLTDIANKKPRRSHLYVHELHHDPQPPRLRAPPGGGLANVRSSGLLEGLAAFMTPSLPNVPSSGLLEGLGALVTPSPPQDRWVKVEVEEFLNKLKPDYQNPVLRHADSTFRSFFPLAEEVEGVAPPAILMTEAVYKKFAQANQNRACVKENYFKPYTVRIVGETQSVYGGNVTYVI